jgi:3',5'-cyclic AMP phosphodiesterase CpdA
MARSVERVNFLHFSDIHIPDQRGDKRESWYNVDPCRQLDKLIAFADTLAFNPAFTVVTGDVSDTGTTQSYELAKHYLAKLEQLGGCVIPTMGTRDNRRNFRTVLLGNPATEDEPPCYYSKTIDGLHVVAMDSHTPGSRTGSFSEAQLDWLAVELEDHHHEPSIIAFHEPIFYFGEYGVFDKADALRFRKILAEGNVLAVLNGHAHCPLYTMVDGVQYVQAGSPLWVQYHGDDKVSRYDAASFNVLSYREDLQKQLLIGPVYYSEGIRPVRKIP